LLGLAVLVLLCRRSGAVGAGVEGRERDAAERQRWAQELERQAEELSRRARDQEAYYRGLFSGLETAVDYLVGVQLPAILAGSPAPAPSSGSDAARSSEAAALCDRVTGAVAEGVSGLGKQFSYRVESSRLAVVALARKVQASAHRIQSEATELENLPQAAREVVESGMRVDHSAAQQGRNAQSLLVLCGEWPGVQWPQPLALQDVVRAAAGRILAYKRVEVLGEPGIAAAASVAEPLIHLVAELLSNATQSSPPSTKVQVTVRAVQRGAVIEIDDSGVGMEEHDLDLAREIVTGLAVVGQYARRHPFRVDLNESPYGGVRAVVLVPAELTEPLESVAIPPTPPRQVPASGPEPGDEGIVRLPRASESLPQRQSRRGEPPQDRSGYLPSAEPADVPRQTPEQAGEFLASFIRTAPGTPGADTGAASAGGEDEDAAFPGGTPQPGPGSADFPGEQD
jgi:hypothetical protein